jgi:hypothetical protein
MLMSKGLPSNNLCQRFWFEVSSVYLRRFLHE